MNLLQKNCTPHEDCLNLLKLLNNFTLTFTLSSPRIPGNKKCINYINEQQSAYTKMKWGNLKLLQDYSLFK